MPEENVQWITGENERRERYKKILEKGSHLELIQMLKAIYAHKREREVAGKRLHMSDERFLKDAEQILYNEFQYVLGISDKEELMAYIMERIEKKQILQETKIHVIISQKQ